MDRDRRPIDIEWNEQESTLHLDGARKVLLDARALGMQRKTLINTVGVENARGALRRVGFQRGNADCTTYSRDVTDRDELLMLGFELEMRSGHAHVEVRRIETEPDFVIEGVWRNSFEAQQHVAFIGRSDAPVCWSTEGFLSGWVSTWFGRRVLTLETQCIGMGDPHCSFVIRPAEEWGAQASAFLRDLGDIGIDRSRSMSLLDQLAADLRATQSRLVNSEAKYRALFENATDIMLLCDPDTGHIVDANRETERRFDLTQAQLVSRKLRDLVVPGDVERVDALLGSKKKYSRSQSLDITLAGCDGAEILVEAIFSTVPYAGTMVLQVVCHDVTEMARTRKALHEAEEMAHIGSLASAVAHEIRNPLSAIVSGVRLLTSTERSDEERTVIFNTISTESERLDSTLNDFLQFARPRNPQRRPVDLSSMVGDLISIIWSDEDTVGDIRANTDLPEEVFLVECDGNQIRQVFWNTILNGIQSMHGKGALRVSLCEEGDMARIEISDTGPGIPREELTKVFEPFHTTKPRGTGLGLPIARRIIMAHGGDIRLDSVVGDGTTAVITLPVHNPDA
jgi:PAS domain S-box-containing protein